MAQLRLRGHKGYKPFTLSRPADEVGLVCGGCGSRAWVGAERVDFGLRWRVVCSGGCGRKGRWAGEKEEALRLWRAGLTD